MLVYLDRGYRRGGYIEGKIGRLRPAWTYLCTVIGDFEVFEASVLLVVEVSCEVIDRAI